MSRTRRQRSRRQNHFSSATLMRKRSVAALPVETYSGIKTDKNEDFEWPQRTEDDERLISHVQSSLASANLIASPLSDQVILAYLAFNENTPRHAVEAIKRTIEWRKGRQMFLNHFHTQSARYLFFQKCRSQGIGTSSIFGKAKDGRLVFYEKFGENWNLDIYKEFGESEMTEFVTIWCETLLSCAIKNMKPEFQAKYHVFAPLIGKYQINSFETDSSLSKEIDPAEEDDDDDGGASVKSVEFHEDIKERNNQMTEKKEQSPVHDRGPLLTRGFDTNENGIVNLFLSFGIDMKRHEEAFIQIGNCEHGDVIGIIDWSGIKFDQIVNNLRLLIAANALISTHYPFLIYKYIHVNMPVSMQSFVKIYSVLSKKVHIQSIEKSVFVGTDKEKFSETIDEMKESLDVIENAIQSATNSDLRGSSSSRKTRASSTASSLVSAAQRKSSANLLANSSNTGGGSSHHARNASDLRARRLAYGGRGKKSTTQSREEAERQRAAEELQIEKERRAKMEKEESFYMNENFNVTRSRLAWIRSQIDESLLPREYGGKCPSNQCLVSGLAMYRNLLGVSAEKNDPKFKAYNRHKFTRDSRKINDIIHNDLKSNENDLDVDDEDDEDTVQKEWNEPEDILIKTEKKEKLIRARDTIIIRWKADRGDMFRWIFNAKEEGQSVLFSLVFHADTGRGKTIKEIIRQEAEHKCHVYSNYGQFVAIQSGKVELLWKTPPSQRRVSFRYEVTQSKMPAKLVEEYLPVVPGSAHQSKSRGAKGRYHRMTQSSKVKSRNVSSKGISTRGARISTRRRQSRSGKPGDPSVGSLQSDDEASTHKEKPLVNPSGSGHERVGSEPPPDNPINAMGASQKSIESDVSDLGDDDDDGRRALKRTQSNDDVADSEKNAMGGAAQVHTQSVGDGKSGSLTPRKTRRSKKMDVPSSAEKGRSKSSGSRASTKIPSSSSSSSSKKRSKSKRKSSK